MPSPPLPRRDKLGNVAKKPIASFKLGLVRLTFGLRETPAIYYVELNKIMYFCPYCGERYEDDFDELKTKYHVTWDIREKGLLVAKVCKRCGRMFQFRLRGRLCREYDKMDRMIREAEAKKRKILKGSREAK